MVFRADLGWIAGGSPLIVLSPHLDDAVISVGGLIARAAAEGIKVSVRTIFTSDPGPLSQVPRRFRRLLINAGRRDEDRAAVTSLGAEPVWLGFHERATLEPPLPHFLGVFSLPRPPELSQFRNLAALKTEIVRLVSMPERPIIAAPLAVGGHIDHVEVFLASMLAMRETGSCERFVFYEDAYTMSARARRRHFLASQERWPVRKSPALAGLVGAGMLTVMGWAERGPKVHEYLPEAIAQTAWQRMLVPLEDFESAKLRAMGLYVSQMKKLGGYRAFSAIVRRWHQVRQGAECLWMPSM
ncbi:MAG TPA: PIG-L family deacetylase [Thermoleophilia bacterium]|nr:PIG-L family deacetylase [Thermoleophilia bacterium]